MILTVYMCDTMLCLLCRCVLLGIVMKKKVAGKLRCLLISLSCWQRSPYCSLRSNSWETGSGYELQTPHCLIFVIISNTRVVSFLIATLVANQKKWFKYLFLSWWLVKCCWLLRKWNSVKVIDTVWIRRGFIIPLFTKKTKTWSTEATETTWGRESKIISFLKVSHFTEFCL